MLTVQGGSLMQAYIYGHGARWVKLPLKTTIATNGYVEVLSLGTKWYLAIVLVIQLLGSLSL